MCSRHCFDCIFSSSNPTNKLKRYLYVPFYRLWIQGTEKLGKILRSQSHSLLVANLKLKFSSDSKACTSNHYTNISTKISPCDSQSKLQFFLALNKQKTWQFSTKHGKVPRHLSTPDSFHSHTFLPSWNSVLEERPHHLPFLSLDKTLFNNLSFSSM